MTLAEDWDDFCHRKGFTMVPNEMLRYDIGLDAYAHRVLVTLMSWTRDLEEPARRHRGKPIRISNLAEWTGFHRTTVTRALTTLEKEGLISVSQEEGATHEYQVLFANVVAAYMSVGPT